MTSSHLVDPDKAIVAKLARAARGGLISTAEAISALQKPPHIVASKLSSLAKRGWLQRARRGLYLVLPLEAGPGKAAVAEDPWILAHVSFSPCYIGGWSAAEHWGLTEQLFRSTLVVTAAHIRSRAVRILGHDFRLFRVPIERIDDTALVWRGSEQVPVSTRERTIADCLADPELSGGIRHLADILAAYGADEKDLNKLLQTVRELRNGAALKRLGYLIELLWPEKEAVIDTIQKTLTEGYVRLDPAVKTKGKLLRRWRLWINVQIRTEAGAA